MCVCVKSINILSISKVCDSVKDCSDDSDESSDACEYVRKSKIVQCNPVTHFRCDSKDLCISKIFKCDGNFECLDKRDELNCSSSCNPSKM